MTKNIRSSENNTRKIEVTDGKIVYTLKRDGTQDYLTYNHTLYEILQLNSLSPFRNNGRLQMKVQRNGVKHYMYLYDLAIACYMGIVKVETFLEDMQGYFEFKERQGLSVDHLDNHIRNNTRFNLSLMKRVTNTQKSDITARAEKPSMLIPCYVDGQYRVHYERRCVMCNCVIGDVNRELDSSGMPMIVGQPQFTISQSFACEDAESLVQCLNWIANRKIAYRGVDMVLPMRTARGLWNLSGIGRYTDDVLTSIKAQELLANRQIQEFQAYDYERDNT